MVGVNLVPDESSVHLLLWTSTAGEHYPGLLYNQISMADAAWRLLLSLFLSDNFLFTLCNNLKPSCPQLPSNHPRLNESRMVALKTNFCPSDHDWRWFGHHLWSKNAAEIQCVGVRTVPDTPQFTGSEV